MIRRQLMPDALKNIFADNTKIEFDEHMTKMSSFYTQLVKVLR